MLRQHRSVGLIVVLLLLWSLDMSVRGQETAPPPAEPTSAGQTEPTEVQAEVAASADSRDAEASPSAATPSAATPPTLEFSFREQEWIEVLDWFAKQADLSLVVNELPPGNFTYSDTKRYTPTEALDLLNGVLITRGFALVRRERVLVCANLNDGIPDGLIPRVEITQLDQFGQFEWVQILFPIGRRVGTTVVAEVEPLLGKHGDITLLPETRQVLIIATAGKMRSIRAVIESIDEPRPPAAAPPAPEPILTSYPIEGFDPEPAVEMLKTLAGAAKITIDRTTNQLNVVALPAHHTIIEQFLRQIASNTPNAQGPELKVYPIAAPSPTALIEQLKIVVPQATLSVDAADATRLVAYAHASDHERIAEALQTLDAANGDATPTTLVPAVYVLQRADAATLLPLVQALYPRLKITADTANRRLLVVGTTAQQTTLQGLLQQWDAQGVETLRIQDYALERLDPANVQSTLSSLVPSARLSVDNEQRRLRVIGTTEQQQQIEGLLEQLARSAPSPRERVLKKHAVTAEQRERYLRLAGQIDPELKNLQPLESTQPGTLLMLATEEQHQRVANVLAELASQFTSEERKLRFYEVPTAVKDKFTTLHGQLAPQLGPIQIVADANDPRLGILASTAQHEQIGLVIEELRQAIPDQPAQLRVFTVTPTQRQRLTALQSTLGSTFPALKFLPETKATELAVWGPIEPLERFAQMLPSLATNATGPELQLVTYPLAEGDPATMQKVLAELYPDTKVLIDAESRRVMVWGTPAQQTALGEAIRQLDIPPSAGKQRMAHYPVGEMDVRNVLEMFQRLVPKMTLLAERDSNSVVAWGNDDDHTKLTEIISQFRNHDAASQRKVVSYPCGTMDVFRVRSLIDDLVPTARLLADRSRRTLLAWATPDEHRAIEEAMREIAVPTEAGGATIRSYEVTRQDVGDIIDLLQEVMPGVQLQEASDERHILAWTTPSQHEQLSTMLKEVDQGFDGEVRAYKLQRANVSQVRELLEDTIPQARWIPTDAPQQVILSASTGDHQVIRQLIEQLEASLGESVAQTVRVYPLEPATPEIIRPLLPPELLRGVTLIPDTVHQAFLVRATDDQHIALQQALREILATLPAEKKRSAKVYRFQHADPALHVAALTAQFPQATLSVDPTTRSLLASAYTPDHERIDAMVRELDRPLESQQVTQTYRLRSGNIMATRDAIQALVPKAVLAADPVNRTLLATATPNEQQRIEAALTQLSHPEPDDRTTQAYPLRYANVDAASDAIDALLPGARVVADSTNRTLLVTGTAADQERVQQILEELDAERAPAGETQVYRLKHGTPDAAVTALRELLPQATIVADVAQRAVLVTAASTDQARVREALTQLDAPTTNPTETRTYVLEHGDPAAAVRVFTSLLPRAVLAADGANRTMIVTARPEDHAQIAAALPEFDRPSAQQQRLEAYPIRRARLDAVQTALQQMYSKDQSVSISSDAVNQTILARATPREQASIAQVIAQMENSVQFQQERTLETYRVKTNDGNALVDSLKKLVQGHQPAAELSYSEQSQQILALATAEQQTLLRSALERLKTEATRLEVFPLQSVDPFAIEAAIDRLYDGSRHRPIANGDTETQQLFVRGTETQLAEVRALLQKMGELPDVLHSSLEGQRVVPFRGDVKRSLEQLESIWPRLRTNRLEIMRLDATPKIESSDTDQNAPNHGSSDELPAQDESKRAVEDQSSTEPRDSSPAANEAHDIAPAQPHAAEPNPAPPASQPAAGDQSSASKSPPPVIIVPQPGAITILSDDPEALRQAEQLMRTIARLHLDDASAGNFAVFTLHNAGANKVAKTLEALFEQMPITTRATLGRVSMVPDDRLNALIVHGRPADRAVLGELLRVLDSSNVPDSLASAKPQIVPLQTMSANDAIRILRTVYKTQLESGGQRPEIEIPEGVDSDVATMIQQINAMASGPLLTLEIDSVTNSLVILAPRELTEEVASLAKQLDANSQQGDRRTIDIVSLKDTNVRQIQRALNELMRARRSNSSR